MYCSTDLRLTVDVRAMGKQYQMSQCHDIARSTTYNVQRRKFNMQKWEGNSVAKLSRKKRLRAEEGERTECSRGDRSDPLLPPF